MQRVTVLPALALVLCASSAAAQQGHGHDHGEPAPYAAELAHAPTPLPDRVVLTWSDDPATTQSVTWRTDTSVATAVAEIAVANANGRALEPRRLGADTPFRSDLNDAHYHSLTFRDLRPDTLYAYRVGDGVNWSEYQVIDIDDAHLRFRAFTATGELYDAFTLEKRDGQPNRLREALPPENRSPTDAP